MVRGLSMATQAPLAERWYATTWRWHFYAGLFTAPFILWLSITGGIYLFKPQIEAWLDRPYDALAIQGPAAAPSTLARAAQEAVPGAVLHRYILPAEPDDAQRVVVGIGAEETRLYLHPQTGEVLHRVGEDDRLMMVIFLLHGELMGGRWGSALVELAASWAIVLLLSGLFLWWPRTNGLAGVLWPRLDKGRRIRWRDLHAVTGFWVSLAAIFLIFSGLPWAKNWGGYLQAVREATGQVSGPVDWSQGSDHEREARAALDARSRAALGSHYGSGSIEHHGHGAVAATQAVEGGVGAATPDMLLQLDRVVPSVARLGLAGPVEITPPVHPGSSVWQVASEAANRPKRATAEVDGTDGRVIGRVDFAQRHWIDRAVGYGVAIHEGAFFGWPNQVLGLLVVSALALLSISAVVLWWRRRPHGRLGAPPVQGRLRHSWALVALTVLLAFVVPLFGISLALVVAAEHLVLRRCVRASRFLGLRGVGAP